MLKCSLLLFFLLPLAVAQSIPVEEILPAVEKTTFLWHFSYLTLANIPNLGNMIRRRAVETQMLFMDSDATMLRCALTSRNLVHSLFPMARKAAEENTPLVAFDHLKKAQDWIKEIDRDADLMVDKYDLHLKNVASFTSDVIREKHDTEARISGQSQGVEQSEAIVYYLEEAPQLLSIIQKNLIELKRFWENISKLLADLEQRTFVGEVLGFIVKDEFISSIQAAEKAWSSLGDRFERASVIFRQKTKDAFKFLEVTPVSLSKEQWQEEFERVKARLQNPQ